MDPPPGCAPAPILQQLFDCSNADAEISSLALVSSFADGPAHALAWHDAPGLVVNTFLTQVIQALEPRFPGLRVSAQSLRGHASPSPPMTVRIDREGRAQLGGLIPAGRLEIALGISATEVASVVDTAVRAYRYFMPTLPEPAELGPATAGIDIRTAHDRVQRASGYLLVGADRRAAVILHDAGPESSGAVNSYLGAAVSRAAAPTSWRLSEHCLRQVDDHFCRVEPCDPAASTLPVRSTTSLSLAEAARTIGLQPFRLANVVDRARDLRRWRSPFAGVRPLRISRPALHLSPPSAGNVAASPREPGPGARRTGRCR